MKRISKFFAGLVFAFVLTFAGTASAQSHSVTLSWVPSTSAGVISQLVYRAVCSGTVTAAVCSTDSTSTFAKLATSIGPTATSFVDTSVLGGTNYIYYMTALGATGCVGTCESIPSNHVAVTIPNSPPPNPPTVLKVTLVALNRIGANDQIVASWSDTPNVPTAYKFDAQGRVLSQGVKNDATGIYTVTITVPHTNAEGYFQVCDVNGCATSKYKG